MKRLLLAFLSVFLMAATAGEVIPALEERGFFIEEGSDASPGVVGDAIADAGFAGGRLYVVVLAEEPASGATFFADAVLDELEQGTVLTVAPETVGYASDGESWSPEELDEAVEASLDASSDEGVVVRFVESLTGDLSGGGGEQGGEGGGSGWIWFLVIGGGLLLLFLFIRSKSNKSAANARHERLRQFRTAAQAKLADIANDILDMEDEVKLSENPEVKAHYDRAASRYAEAIDAVDTASDPQELIDLTYQLDLAIWELDYAEAILDGKKPPEKPEKPEPPPVPTHSPAGEGRTPDYDRRPTRQSTPAGPDLGNVLMSILIAQSLGGRGGAGGGWTGAPGRGGGGFGGGGGRGGFGRLRGGGRRRG